MNTSKASANDNLLDNDDDEQNWIVLDMRLLNWSYMNFRLKLRQRTPVFSLKRELEERHGQITSIKLCLNHFADRNELVDEMKSLADYGLKGGSVDEHDPDMQQYIIYYDFKHCDQSDPLLLAT